MCGLKALVQILTMSEYAGEFMTIDFAKNILDEVFHLVQFQYGFRRLEVL